MHYPRMEMRTEPITERQLEVARLIAEGRSNPEIADALGITLDGAKYHVSELLGRLGLERREEVAEWIRSRPTAEAEPAARSPSTRRRLRALWMPAVAVGAVLPAVIVAVALGGGLAGDPPPPTPPPPALIAATEIPEATPTPTPPPTTAPAVVAVEYVVQEGDTLQSIATRFGLTPNDIRWNNVDTEAALPPGRLLRIPSTSGIIHEVREGETTTAIAAMYDADWRDIVDFPPNDLRGDPNNLRPGTRILVPGGRIVPLVAVPPLPAGNDTATGWIWPVTGEVTTPFGPSSPLGIDILAEVGTPVVASNSGVASFVGGNPCCDYGYYVTLDHGDGYETLYAHLSQFAVATGQHVYAGDTLGWIGATGQTDGRRLHFELHRNGIYADPVAYLP